MDKRFRTYDPGQPYLLPPSPRDWIPEDHLVHFIADVVKQLDLSGIYGRYAAAGQPAYHPMMMTAVWLYAFSQGIRSSRRIERALHEDIGFRLLSGDQQPDFWTLNQFRKRHRSALAGIFKQTVHLAQKLGFVKLGHVAIDGTKLKGNASKHAAMSYGRMVEAEAKLVEQLNAYFREADEVDDGEDKKFGKGKRGDELPEDLQHAAKRLRAIQKAKKELEEEAVERAKADQQKRREVAEAEGRDYKPRLNPEEAKPDPKAQRNFTDPESRIMRNSEKAFCQGYNGQTAVDAGSHIIVAADLTNSSADCPHFESMIGQVISNCGDAPDQVSADAGYFSEANLDVCKKHDIEAFIPPGRVEHSVWRSQQSPRGRIPKDASTAYLMKRKLSTKRGREIYKLRHVTAEPVFGHIKSVRGLQQFLHRGLEKVRDYWLLDCAVQNMLRLFRLGAKI